MGLLGLCRRVPVSFTCCGLGRGTGGVGVSKFV